MNNPKPTTPPSRRLALKIPEAAALIGVSETSIRRAINRGQLRACRRFRHLLITVDQLRRFLDADAAGDSVNCQLKGEPQNG